MKILIIGFTIEKKIYFENYDNVASIGIDPFDNYKEKDSIYNGLHCIWVSDRDRRFERIDHSYINKIMIWDVQRAVCELLKQNMTSWQVEYHSTTILPSDNCNCILTRKIPNESTN